MVKETMSKWIQRGENVTQTLSLFGRALKFQPRGCTVWGIELNLAALMLTTIFFSKMFILLGQNKTLMQ